MRILAQGFDLGSFIESMRRAPARVLMLDYDGTLAPFRVNPAEAVPYPGVTEAIDEIVGAGGTRVVIVSGRPASEVPPLLATAHRPEIWGAHGWERLMPDGRLIVNEPEPAARDALLDARQKAQYLVAAGARIEEKRASIALHWRGLPSDAGAELAAQALGAWSPLAAANDNVEILPFDAGLELRARGFDKAHAVNAILDESDDGAAAAYLGDDVTDEDAFRALGSRGLAVLVRTEVRQTQARLWLKPPEELLSFMLKWRVEMR